MASRALSQPTLVTGTAVRQQCAQASESMRRLVKTAEDMCVSSEGRWVCAEDELTWEVGVRVRRLLVCREAAVASEGLQQHAKTDEMMELHKEAMKQMLLAQKQAAALLQVEARVAAGDLQPNTNFSEWLRVAVEAAASSPGDMEEKARAEVYKVGQRAEYAPQGDDDLVMQTATAGTICPITRTEYVEPMRNPRCNHVYSKKAAADWFRTERQRRRAVRCPVAACRQALVLEELVSDRETELALRRGATQPTQQVDSDGEYEAV